MDQLLSALFLCVAVGSASALLKLDLRVGLAPQAPLVSDNPYDVLQMSNVYWQKVEPDENGLLLPPGQRLKTCNHKRQCTRFETCRDGKCQKVCEVSCGPNTNCIAKNHEALCTCKPGYAGDPRAGCFGITDECRRIECTEHDNCPDDEACISNECKSPCEHLCGENAMCKVTRHIPVCACPEGFGGNPFYQCKKGEDVEGNGGHIGGDDNERKGCNSKVWPEEGKKQKKYRYSANVKLDWIGAYLNCFATGQRLASVDTEEEWNHLNDLLQKNAPKSFYWISGMGQGKKDIPWMWMSKEKNIDPKVQKWDGENPDFQNNNEHCLHLRIKEGSTTGYTWNDLDCSQPLNFICETYD